MIKTEEIWGACFIILICIVVLGILFFKNRLEMVIGFIMRGIVGTIAIYGINRLLLLYGISQSVGINPLTVITGAVLGIPGILALFVIVFL